MGRSLRLLVGLVGCLAIGGACSPDVSDEVVVDGDVPGDGATPAVDLPAPLDRSVPVVDVPAFDGGVVVRDVPTIIDVGAPLDRLTIIDVGTAPDRPTVVDVPAVDLGPPDAGCPLPAPAARPPAGPPDLSGVVRAVAAEHADWLLDSCVPMGGSYRFLFEALRRARATDPRWGLDRRTGSLGGDLLTYFYGDGCPEGRREVYMIDVILRLCARAGVDEPAAPGWIDRSSEGGVWTLMGYDATPPPDAGTPPVDVPVARPALPDGRPTLEAVARERPDLLRNSCVADGGNNDFLFEVVRRLRRIDRRWGLNWKRGRVGDMSQDVVDYYFGASPTPVEGSLETYVVDVIAGHCGPTPGTTWIDQTGVGGAEARWTLAGRTDL